MVSKPLLDWARHKFKDKFSKMGYKPKFIGKPVTIEDIVGTDRHLLDLSNISTQSRKDIQKYLNEVEADGALVLDIQQQGTLFPRYPSSSYGNITIAPYKLIPSED
jgi:hypothetical protein